MISPVDDGRLVGYARVSTGGQDLGLQLDALQKQGVPKQLIFTDKESGSKSKRPGLDACLQELRPDDVLLVWRLGSTRALGKEPDFWHVTGRDQESGDWRSLSTPSSDLAVTTSSPWTTCGRG